MTPETTRRLRDVCATCSEIEAFTAGVDEQAFLASQQVHLSVHKLLEIVAEALNAAYRSNNALVNTIPDFRNFINLRNQITHRYFDVNYGIVWRVAVQEVPRLRTFIEELLQAEAEISPENVDPAGGDT